MINILISLGLKISDLLDPHSRGWNMEKLHELFYMEDIIRIKKIQTVIYKEDFWVWLHNRNEMYSVNSGYRMTCRVNISEERLHAKM